MSSQPLSAAIAELTVEEPQLLRLPEAILELLDAKGSSALFLIQQDDLGTLTLRTVADLVDNTIVPRIPSGHLRRPAFCSTPLFEELTARAREIARLPQASLGPDGTLEIPAAVSPLPPGTRLRVEVADSPSGRAKLLLLLQADEPLHSV